jgi:Xaa-Pro aminopeptidase
MIPFRFGFSSDCFARRRAAVLSRIGSGVLVLPAGRVLRRSRDTEHRYRPDSELFYLTGVTDSGVVAVLGGSLESPYILFAKAPDPKEERWIGPRASLQELQEAAEADEVFPLEELEERLPKILQAHSRVFFRLGGDDRVETLVRDSLTWARTRGTRSGSGPRAVEDPGTLLDPLRLVKDQEEIQRIRRAASVTVQAVAGVMSLARPGLGEWELEASFDHHLRMDGAQGPAFPTIVGSGENACVLHYTENRRRMRKGDLVLVDGGAEVDLYAADVSRTFPVGGGFERRQQEVYQVVLGAQAAALSRVRSGASVASLHEAALEAITEGLVDLGVLRGDPVVLAEEKAYEPFFPHQTTHWLGLDVHDPGDYASGQGSRVLEPGMVLTVEPGLYFSPWGPEGEGPWAGLGVRLEDDILVTEDGYENLTRRLPLDPEEVAALVTDGGDL